MYLIELLLTILTTSSYDVEALRRTAPMYLTTETARDHLIAAKLAARRTGTRPAELLSIAHHESRYSLRERTRESRGRVSCGVMTPTPIKRCRARTLVESYLDGARHLQGWYRAGKGSRWFAYTGYAGGYRLIRFCARGGRARGCNMLWRFGERARRIERAWRSREAGLQSSS